MIPLLLKQAKRFFTQRALCLNCFYNYINSSCYFPLSSGINDRDVERLNEFCNCGGAKDKDKYLPSFTARETHPQERREGMYKR